MTIEMTHTESEWAAWVVVKMEQLVTEDLEHAREIAETVLVEARSMAKRLPVALVGEDGRDHARFIEDSFAEIASCATGCRHCKVVATDAADALGLDV